MGIKFEPKNQAFPRAGLGPEHLPEKMNTYL